MSLLDQLRRFFNGFRVYWLGKKIALIGPSKAGKTTFVRFLLTGSINGDTSQTLSSEDYKLSPEALELPKHWSVATDHNGADGAQDQWQHATIHGDLVLYFVDGARLIRGEKSEEHARRIHEDCARLHSWIGEHSIPCCIVVTHLDLCTTQELATLDSNEELVMLTAALGGSTKRVHVARGSLECTESALNLLKEIDKSRSTSP